MWLYLNEPSRFCESRRYFEAGLVAHLRVDDEAGARAARRRACTTVTVTDPSCVRRAVAARNPSRP